MRGFVRGRGTGVDADGVVAYACRGRFNFSSGVGLVCGKFATVSRRVCPCVCSKGVGVLFTNQFIPRGKVPILVGVVGEMSRGMFCFRVTNGKPLRRVVLRRLKGGSGIHVAPPVFDLTRCLSSFSCMFVPDRRRKLGSLSVRSSVGGIPIVVGSVSKLGRALPRGCPLGIGGGYVSRCVALFASMVPAVSQISLVSDMCRCSYRGFSVRRVRGRCRCVCGAKGGCNYFFRRG